MASRLALLFYECVVPSVFQTNNNNNKKFDRLYSIALSMHNTLNYLNANYLREDEHLARVITSSNAFSKSRKICTTNQNI
ncbi:hypothetical protein DERP_005014 [Dermatophagoides pteronyssinus]|uniref:Uncharacterized protein n=1 Tax=Dermatophagoides pteronyssinus TaxID=6956 RepID=A0ABQ8JT59_DERPT|nr:hypothetical protein DERP_005014 [Dermatophagoides pteronyssinus]